MQRIGPVGLQDVEQLRREWADPGPVLGVDRQDVSPAVVALGDLLIGGRVAVQPRPLPEAAVDRVASR